VKRDKTKTKTIPLKREIVRVLSPREIQQVAGAGNSEDCSAGASHCFDCKPF
jgi:hypothetical protein